MSAVPPSPVVPTGRRVEVGRVESADALIGGDYAEVVIVVRVVLDHQTVTELSQKKHSESECIKELAIGWSLFGWG